MFLKFLNSQYLLLAVWFEASVLCKEAALEQHWECVTSSADVKNVI